jgi:hypothetical protein
MKTIEWRDKYPEREVLLKENATMRIYIKGAIAALTQNKTYPADVVAAKSFLNSALNV